MRKAALALILLCTSTLYAEHLEIRNASNLTAGTLPNERLDPSSVTLQGNNFNGLSIGSGFSQFQATAIAVSKYYDSNNSTVSALVNSTASLQSQVTSIVGGFLIPRVYEVVVGTPGARGTDFNVAVDTDLWAPLAALGANGLFNGTTVHGKILFVGGPFNIMNATVPAGITFAMIPGSSSCWKPIQSTGTIITVYGDGVTPSLENFTIDGGSRPCFTGEQIVLATGALINGLRIFNFVAPSRATQSNIIAIFKTTNVVVNDLFMDNYSGRVEAVAFADGASIYVWMSSDVYFNRPVLGRFTGFGSNFSAWGFAATRGLHVRDGKFLNCFGDWMTFNGGNTAYDIARNDFHINGTYSAGRGIIGGVAQQWGSTSTGSITSNNFYHEPSGGNSPIISLNNQTFPMNGCIIAHNVFYILWTGMNAAAIAIQTNVADTFLLYNFIEGTASYTDAGTRTRIVQ